MGEGYDRGWSAMIDGEPAEVFPAYAALMAVPVPAGQHVLILRFRPVSWTLALWLWAAGCMAVAVTVVVDARARTLGAEPRRKVLGSSRESRRGRVS